MRPKPCPVAVKASREDSRVVENYKIVRTKKVGELPEKSVFDLSGCRGEVKKTRGRSVGKGLLRNQLLGQIVVEIGN